MLLLIFSFSSANIKKFQSETVRSRIKKKICSRRRKKSERVD